MWWAIYFTAVTLMLLAVAGTLAVLTDAYSKALDAYRLAKLTLDQWSSLTSQLNNTVCTAAEEMAKDAVKTLNVERYRELGPAFARAMEEVKTKTFLKRLNYSWAFNGDVFQYSLTFLRRSAAGAVDWLRPMELIEVVQRIKSMSFDLTVSTVYDTLRPLVPRGAALSGVVYGHLTGNGTYTGTLTGEYTLRDKTPLRCAGGSLSVSFTASHYASLTLNSTQPSVYIYEVVYIDN
ncbi:MAG: hypothetical protein ACO2PM_06780 [Pyrobaculum sp.]